MRRRWRPRLALVLAGGLGVTLAVSLAGLVALRLLGPAFGFRATALAIGAAILLATGVIGWLQLRLLLRPLRAVEAFATLAERGDPAPLPRHFGTQELHATAGAVMSMAATLRDREATVRSFTDHVTHELRTPVSVLCAAVELLTDEQSPTPGQARLLDQIGGAARQIEAQLLALREAARARETRYLGQTTLASVAPGLQDRFPALTIGLSGGDVAVPISARGLDLILGHLLRNAEESGARQVRLSMADALTVTDDGTGLPDIEPSRLFEPFFTTRRETGGTGMGLTIVRNILYAHGAAIEALGTGSGAGFRVTFGAQRAA